MTARVFEEQEFHLLNWTAIIALAPLDLWLRRPDDSRILTEILTRIPAKILKKKMNHFKLFTVIGSANESTGSWSYWSHSSHWRSFCANTL